MFYFQVGVEIRNELQLIEPLEVRHDTSREVSKTENDRHSGIWVPLFGTDIFPHSANFAPFYVHTTLNISVPRKQQIIVLLTGYP